MAAQKLKIGFIGLGKMGSGMCQNIQQAGYDLIVYNRTLSKTRPFEENGARVAKTIPELVACSDIIFTSLFDDQSVIDLCHGQDGIFNAITPEKIHIGLTTIQPSTADQLKAEHEKHHCHYISAPVVGRPDAAELGRLITFLAGDSLAIQQALPVIETYSIRQVLVGETASAASAMKICVNYMTMAQLAMLGEVFTFAEKMQLDNPLVLNIVELFFSGNEAIKEYAGKIAKRDFDTAGFELAAGLKDACIFEKAFNSCDVIPSAILGAKHNLVTAQHIGLGKKDWSALTEISRMMAGL